MALEKATITPEGKDPIEVLFNPTQYSLDHGNQIAEIGVPGLSAPILQYVRGNSRKLSMELFFDTYEEQTKVSDHTKRIYGLLDIDETKHRPPICTFAWGEFKFECVLEQASGRFTLFLSDGTPVRATLNVTFKEFIEVKDLVRTKPLESSDHVKTRTLQRGQTLSSIAAAEYDDPATWRPIADANGIDNPRQLEPGVELVVPRVT